MIFFFALLALVIAYFFLVFIVIRLVVPFMGFSELQLPSEIPDAVRKKITELESNSSSPLEYLEAVYLYVTKTWHAGRMNVVFLSHLAFRKDLTLLLSTPGFAQCNTQNYIVFVLLAGSKYFKASDIRIKTVFFNMFIHQYLEVTVDGKDIHVDPAGASIRGMPLGTHIEFFG